MLIAALLGFAIAIYAAIRMLIKLVGGSVGGGVKNGARGLTNGVLVIYSGALPAVFFLQLSLSWSG